VFHSIHDLEALSYLRLGRAAFKDAAEGHDRRSRGFNRAWARNRDTATSEFTKGVRPDRSNPLPAEFPRETDLCEGQALTSRTEMSWKAGIVLRENVGPLDALREFSNKNRRRLLASCRPLRIAAFIPVKQAFPHEENISMIGAYWKKARRGRVRMTTLGGTTSEVGNDYTNCCARRMRQRGRGRKLCQGSSGNYVELRAR